MDLVQTIRQRHQLDDQQEVLVKSLVSELTLKEGIVTARITTDDVDTQNEVLLPKGLMSSYFQKSGTVFWNHNYDIPLGKPIKLKPSPDGHSWMSTFKFADRPEGATGAEWDQLDWVKSLVAQGIVRGVSVGFVPKERRYPTEQDKERFGKNVQSVVSKYLLLEYSLTSVPVNPSALVQWYKAHEDDVLIKHLARENGIDLDRALQEPPPRPKPKRITVSVPEMRAKDDLVKAVQHDILKRLGIIWV